MLHLRGLSLARDGSTGPVRVIRGLDLDLAAGQRLALLGGNGAGKSSLLRHLAEPGTIPGARVGYLSQDPDEQLVARTVAGEVTLGRPDRDPAPLLADVGLLPLADIDPRLLSAGQKQRLQLAVALAQSPDLLLLDEPGSLQDARQAAWLMDRLRGYAGTLVWATQSRQEALCCERALYLHDGAPGATGTAAAVVDHEDVRWLWRGLAPRAAVQPSAGAEVVASLDGVACRFHQGGAEGISLAVKAGERVGITGPNGCGKSTLLAVLAGLRAPDGGQVVLGDRQLYQRRNRDLDHGLVALAPQFPEYLFVTGSVADEARLAGVTPAVALSAAGLDGTAAARSPHECSGGERRRLALALTVASGRPLVLLDEPTAALDARGRDAVVALVDGLPATASLVVASHDVAFLRACGCRILALGPSGLLPAEA